MDSIPSISDYIVRLKRIYECAVVVHEVENTKDRLGNTHGSLKDIFIRCQSPWNHMDWIPPISTYNVRLKRIDECAVVKHEITNRKNGLGNTIGDLKGITSSAACRKRKWRVTVKIYRLITVNISLHRQIEMDRRMCYSGTWTYTKNRLGIIIGGLKGITSSDAYRIRRRLNQICRRCPEDHCWI